MKFAFKNRVVVFFFQSKKPLDEGERGVKKLA